MIKMILKRVVLMAALICCGTAFSDADVSVDTESQADVSTFEAKAFLKEIRMPLRRDAWGEFTGSIVHKGKKNLKGTMRVRLTFTENAMFTQIVLNDVNVYTLEQKHAEGEAVTATIERPEKEEKPGLFEFGISPEDLTFSFIYWDFVEELPREKRRMCECRVMRLAAPDKSGTVIVFFHAKYGFPMEANWYKKGEKSPWRKLELKGAKRHANGLWFVKEMRMEGNNWKTQLTFDYVERNDN